MEQFFIILTISVAVYSIVDVICNTIVRLRKYDAKIVKHCSKKGSQFTLRTSRPVSFVKKPLKAGEAIIKF